MSEFVNHIRKDLRLLVQSKLLILTMASLIIYSLYTNFFYVKSDITPYKCYVVQDGTLHLPEDTYVMTVNSKEELQACLKQDVEGIGIWKEEGEIYCSFYKASNSRVNEAKKMFAQSLFTEPIAYELRALKALDYTHQKRLMMTSEILFFEITTISFLGIAALFFKEREMGVLKVIGVVPARKSLFIASKLVVFLLNECLFTIGICMLNLGGATSFQVLGRILCQVLLLSPIMVLLGFCFSLLFKNFKQFGFAYTIMIIFLTSPVFLFTNTSLDAQWIVYFPTYQLYTHLRKAFFMEPIHGGYITICIVMVACLFKVCHRLVMNEVRRG
ncbi:MAG: ABC transporter permease [Cellulosilyticaceae bacterium]